MHLLVDVITTCVILFTVNIFFGSFFEKKNSLAWRIATNAVYGLGLIILGQFPEFAFYRLVFNFAFSLIIALFLFDSKLISAVFSSLSLSAVFVLAEIILMAILSGAGLDSNVLMSHDNTRYVYIVLTQLLSFLLVVVILSVTKRKRTAVTIPFIVMLSPGAILGIWLGCELGRIVMDGLVFQPTPFLLAAIGLTYMNILLVFYAERVKEASQRQKEDALVEHHYAMQEEYYEQLRMEQNETRAIVHDIRKYFLAMKALVEKKQLPEASQVLFEVENLIADVGSTIDVGNSVISVILNEYKTRAEEEGIYFNYDVSVTSELSISAADAYILLGNTLDNAIDACSSIPIGDRYINIQMKRHHDILFYRIENPYSDEHMKRIRGKMHGYGLKSVQKCVDKYQGEMTISKEHAIFTLSARLNLGPACSEKQEHNKATVASIL